MKLKPGIIIRQVEDQYILVDSGTVEPKFNGMVKLNESSYILLTMLKEDEYSLDELILKIGEEYEIGDIEISAIKDLISQLKENHIIYGE